MSRRIYLMVVFGLFSGVSTSYAQQKEYITFSDTKGKIIDCKGRAGFQGATLTIKYPTLPAYQKQYARHYLVLDPDPPKNLTLEQGGFDGPCSKYEISTPPPIERAGNKPIIVGNASGPGKYCQNGRLMIQLVTEGKVTFDGPVREEKCILDPSKTIRLTGQAEDPH